MRILLPVDGSIHSMEAARVAADYAKLKGGQVTVISVVQSIGGMEDHEISPARRERHMDSMTKLAEEAVGKACTLLREQGVTAGGSKTVATSLSVPDVVVDIAENEKIELIILGSR